MQFLQKITCEPNEAVWCKTTTAATERKCALSSFRWHFCRNAFLFLSMIYVRFCESNTQLTVYGLINCSNKCHATCVHKWTLRRELSNRIRYKEIRLDFSQRQSKYAHVLNFLIVVHMQLKNIKMKFLLVPALFSLLFRIKTGNCSGKCRFIASENHVVLCQ